MLMCVCHVDCIVLFIGLFCFVMVAMLRFGIEAVPSIIISLSVKINKFFIKRIVKIVWYGIIEKPIICFIKNDILILPEILVTSV